MFPQYILLVKFQTTVRHQDGCPVQVSDQERERVKVFSQRSMNKFNLRTVAKAMGGRTTGQRGVRGLASEKKVRIGEQEESRYFTGFIGQQIVKQYVILAFQALRDSRQ